ncbi:DUF4158 domain-containing protein [Escherichia coli]|nr:DUF4158 domain-containing protein [Escherichia coli]
MARRQILSLSERESLLALPDDELTLTRMAYFSEHDLALISAHRKPASRFGFAVLLCYLKNVGFAPDKKGTVAKLAMRQPFVLFKGLTFQKLCLPGAFRPGDHHNKMLRPGLCVVHASPQYL